MTLVASVAICCYLIASLLIALRLFQPHQLKIPPRWLGLGIATFAALIQSILLYQAILTSEGLNFSFFHVLSLVTWTITLLLLVSSFGKPVENLGILLFPLAALAIIAELNFPVVYLMKTRPWGVKVHVLISIFAYSVLTLASVQALLLAVQDQHLHNRHPGGFIRALPPLQTMETLLFEMIGLGFFSLTLALISGFVFLDDMFAQRMVHKTILSTAAWLVFGVLLWGRFRFGWRGRTAIIWTLSGFVVLMLAYFGSKAVIELLLHQPY